MLQTDSNTNMIIYSIKLNVDEERFIRNAYSENEAITRFNEDHGRDLYICHQDDEHLKGELREYAKEIKNIKKKQEIKNTSFVGECDSS